MRDSLIDSDDDVALATDSSEITDETDPRIKSVI